MFDVDFIPVSPAGWTDQHPLSPPTRQRQTRGEHGARETAGVSRSRTAMFRFLKILKPTMSLSPRLVRQHTELLIREPFSQSAFYLLPKVRKENRTFESPRVGASRFIHLFGACAFSLCRGLRAVRLC